MHYGCIDVSRQSVAAFRIDEHDAYVNPVRVRDVGKLGITGPVAALTNAVYHATSKRVRDLPIT